VLSALSSPRRAQILNNVAHLRYYDKNVAVTNSNYGADVILTSLAVKATLLFSAERAGADGQLGPG